MERTVWNNRLIDWLKLDALILNLSSKINAISIWSWNISDAEFETLQWITWNIQDQIDAINEWGWSLTPTQITALEWVTWVIEDRLDSLESVWLGDAALKSWNNIFTWTNLFNNSTGFWKAAYGNPVSNASSSSITVDCSQSNNQKITISENTTITFENLFQSTIFNFELNITWIHTINFVCKVLPGNTIVPMYSESWTKPVFSSAWIYHMTLKMSEVACHFLTSWKFQSFVN